MSLPPKLTKWLLANKIMVIFGVTFVVAASGLIYLWQPSTNSGAVAGVKTSKLEISALEKITADNLELNSKISNLEEEIQALKNELAQVQSFYNEELGKINTALSRLATSSISSTPTSSTTNNPLRFPSNNTPSFSSSGQTNGLININTANASQLQVLKGIGEAKARTIIEYRGTIGKFTSKEQLMDVTGIGPAIFANIKDQITL